MSSTARGVAMYNVAAMWYTGLTSDERTETMANLSLEQRRALVEAIAVADSGELTMIESCVQDRRDELALARFDRSERQVRQELAEFDRVQLEDDARLIRKFNADDIDADAICFPSDPTGIDCWEVYEGVSE